MRSADENRAVSWRDADQAFVPAVGYLLLRCSGVQMSQRVLCVRAGRVLSLNTPDPNEDLLPGVKWGRHDVLFTPAYWKAQCWLGHTNRPVDYRLGQSLTEEVAACLLGGHGIPAGVGIAAFRRLQNLGLLNASRSSEHRLMEALRAPLLLGGRTIRYRFAKQRARYLWEAIVRLDQVDPPIHQHRFFRDWLVNLPGIGLKTASWITRNWLASDEVAIIDIHVHRAGVIAGVFPPHLLPRKDYYDLEALFLTFCRSLGVKPSFLDAIIWKHLRQAGRLAVNAFRRSLQNYSVSAKLPAVA